MTQLEVTVDAHQVPVTYRWDGGGLVELEVNGAAVAHFDLRPAVQRALEVHAQHLTERDVEVMLLESFWQTHPEDGVRGEPF